MLTLITGLPGNGKTLYALQYVALWLKRDISAEHPEPRPVYYHGINGLSPALGWHRLDTNDEPVNGDKNPLVAVPTWWICPPRSIIVIDEAQMCGFGVRQRGQVPEWAQLLETHRHRGLDIVLITQNPTLIDPHDRALCELHFHVMRKWGMARATIHEFRPVRSNVVASRKGSIEHHWRYPKEVYTWYTSAEAHTHKRRIPARVLVLLALPFLILGMAWFVWSHYLDPHRKQSAVASVDPSSGTMSAAGARPGAGKLTPIEYLGQFAPRVPGLAYTAPIYDEVTKPVIAPYPAACVASSTRCQCFTQQGTRLETTPALCKGIVEGGFFVSWSQPVSQTPPPAEKAQEAPKPADGAQNGYAMVPHTPTPVAPAVSVLDRDPSMPGGRGKNLPPAVPPANGP